MRPFPSRRVCRQRTAILLITIPLSLLLVIGSVLGAGGKGGKGKRKKGASPTPSGTEGPQSLTNIPLPIGHEAKGLVLPDFDLNGHLRGKFVAASARRIDQDHVNF